MPANNLNDSRDHLSPTQGPIDLDLESAVIGAALFEPGVVERAEGLRPRHFYKGPRRGTRSNSRLIWMAFYPGDYFRDTNHLTTEQHGAYFLLLMECWGRGGVLPVGDNYLAAMARLGASAWRKQRDVILSFFQLGPDGYRHKRITAELAKATAMSEARRAAGKLGAETRWHLDGERMTLASQTDAPSPSQEGLVEGKTEGEDRVSLRLVGL